MAHNFNILPENTFIQWNIWYNIHIWLMVWLSEAITWHSCIARWTTNDGGSTLKDCKYLDHWYTMINIWSNDFFLFWHGLLQSNIWFTDDFTKLCNHLLYIQINTPGCNQDGKELKSIWNSPRKLAEYMCGNNCLLGQVACSQSEL